MTIYYNLNLSGTQVRSSQLMEMWRSLFQKLNQWSWKFLTKTKYMKEQVCHVSDFKLLKVILPRKALLVPMAPWLH